MPKAIMMVYSDPSDPSREGEYREWYDAHIFQALKAVPGMSRAVRYRLSEDQGHPVDVPHRYVTMYEIEADDIAAVHKGLLEAWENGELPSSDVIRPGPIVYWDVDAEIRVSAG